jgi:hypothetical protein
MMSNPMTGIARIAELKNHQKVLVSFFSFDLAYIAAVITAEIPLNREIANAIMPRSRQPSSSTGVKATAKKIITTMHGITT